MLCCGAGLPVALGLSERCVVTRKWGPSPNALFMAEFADRPVSLSDNFRARRWPLSELDIVPLVRVGMVVDLVCEKRLAAKPGPGAVRGV